MSKDEHARRNIRAISGFYYFLSALWLMAGINFAALLARRGALTGRPVFGIAFFLALGVFEFLLARGLRRFQPWTRKAAIVVSALSLMSFFPLGLIMHGAILYVLFKTPWPGSKEPEEIQASPVKT